ncbi:hypothetical protein JAAARDRAFT_489270 [Jaapia argillacea MUCL 33604]|uniref:Uncharacterized protein n=1 Tax=Jaapia argillacea MUCL 33604 TaxID=933084 RepID=A0A067PP13_9AGAM|nr:hypothetical protein JAAARDRAFT_489270 [Jaapia argillacea MUCL 33604]
MGDYFGRVLRLCKDMKTCFVCMILIHFFPRSTCLAPPPIPFFLARSFIDSPSPPDRIPPRANFGSSRPSTPSAVPSISQKRPSPPPPSPPFHQPQRIKRNRNIRLYAQSSLKATRWEGMPISLWDMAAVVIVPLQ